MPLHIISLGAGVQSTTMALMAGHGEISPMPDCAIFADTGWEPKAVYQHLDWLRSPNVLPFPVHVVSGGNLRDAVFSGQNVGGKRFASVPWFIRNPDGSEGIGRRQCTKDYKLMPILRKQIELMGGKRRKAGVTTWIGISLDEAMRMKPSRVQYSVNRFPLIEARMRRTDCIAWMDRHGYPTPPKSACVGCPFHSMAHWRALPKDELADAIEVDKAIRHKAGMKGLQFMHRSRTPLSEVDLSTHEDRGQLNLFINECEGLCGN